MAEKVYPLLENDSLSENAVTNILQDIPVKLGGGKTQLALNELLPMQCLINLLDLLEEYQKDM